MHLARVRGSSHVVERDSDLIAPPALRVRGTLLQPGRRGVLLPRRRRPDPPAGTDAHVRRRPAVHAGLLARPRGARAQDPARGVRRRHRHRAVWSGRTWSSFTAGSNAIAHTLATTIGRAARATDADPVDEETLLDLVAGAHRQPRGRHDIRTPRRGSRPTSSRTCSTPTCRRTQLGGSCRPQHPSPLPGLRHCGHRLPPVRAGATPGPRAQAPGEARGHDAHGRRRRTPLRIRLRRPLLQRVQDPVRRDCRRRSTSSGWRARHRSRPVAALDLVVTSRLPRIGHRCQNAPRWSSHHRHRPARRANTERDAGGRPAMRRGYVCLRSMTARRRPSCRRPPWSRPTS